MHLNAFFKNVCKMVCSYNVTNVDNMYTGIHVTFVRILYLMELRIC